MRGESTSWRSEPASGSSMDVWFHPGLGARLAVEDAPPGGPAAVAVADMRGRGARSGRDEVEAVNAKTAKARSARVLQQHMAALAAGVAGGITGLALGWSSAALAVLHGAQGFPVSLDQWSWVSSLMPIGAAVGALPAGKLVHSLGRKPVILALGPVTLVAWALHLWASSVWQLYAGRTLLGAAVGAGIVVAPIFVAEVAQPAIRGALGTYFQILLCVGILAVYVFGKFLSVWWMNMSCLSVSVVHMLAFAWFPDSPRWYLLHGRTEDAKKAMVFYRGADYDVDVELKLIREGIKAGAANGRPRWDSNSNPAFGPLPLPFGSESDPLLSRRNFRDSPSSHPQGGWGALASPVARKTMAIALVLVVLQQITGVNAITFYTTQLFAGAGGLDAYTASIVVASVEVVACLVSMYFVDRAGRRVMLVVSGSFMAACTGLLGLYFFFQESLLYDMTGVSWAPVILVSVYMFMFAAGWGPVTWVFIGEVFPDNVKGLATGLSSTTVWVFAFLVTKFYPGLAVAVGNFACYWAFCVLCVVACLFVALVMPETKGKSLDEIQALL